MIFYLKIILFLASQICHHTNLMDSFQDLMNFCFPCNNPLYHFTHFPIILLVFVGLYTQGVNSLYTLFITCLVNLQCRNKWSDLSRLLLHREHLKGPEKPLLFRLSPVRILLWISCQQNMLIFGGLFEFHISFQMVDLGVCHFLQGAACILTLLYIPPSPSFYHPAFLNGLVQSLKLFEGVVWLLLPVGEGLPLNSNIPNFHMNANLICHRGFLCLSSLTNV
jgi:hypothetical protein